MIFKLDHMPLSSSSLPNLRFFKVNSAVNFVEYKIFGSNDFKKAQIIRRAGKVSSKYSNWYNNNVNNDTIRSID